MVVECLMTIHYGEDGGPFRGTEEGGVWAVAGE